MLLSIRPWHFEYFRQTLLAEGFKDVGFFQIWKRGQLFGHGRPLAVDTEWHVRAFANGMLESELEYPRNTIKDTLILE
jgi:hypothetical protein